MVYYSRLTNVTPDSHVLPSYTAKLFHWDLGSPYGVFIPAQDPARGISFFKTQNSTTVEIHTHENMVVGATVSLGGFQMTLLFYGNPEDFGMTLGHVYRPRNLLFFKGEDVYCISLGCPNWTGMDVWYSHNDPNATMPTGSA